MNTINQLSRPKKNLSLLNIMLALVMLSCCFALKTAEAAAVNISDYNAKVTASTLKVRSGPSTRYKVISKVTRNQTVKVTHRDGSWLKIRTNKGKRGYVYKTYLKKVSSRKKANTKGERKGTAIPKVVNVKDYNAKVTASTLKVRSGPTSKYKVVGKLKRNQTVKVTHRSGKWYKIKFNKGKSGYAHSRYLKKASSKSSKGKSKPSTKKARVRFSKTSCTAIAFSNQCSQTKSWELNNSFCRAARADMNNQQYKTIDKAINALVKGNTPATRAAAGRTAASIVGQAIGPQVGYYLACMRSTTKSCNTGSKGLTTTCKPKW